MGRGRPSQEDEDNDTYNRDNPDTMILGKSVGTQYHKLTASESGVGSHSHCIERQYGTTGSGTMAIDQDDVGSSNHSCESGAIGTTSKDANNAHNNLSPSLVLIYAIRILK
jgi:microcystin-dependent protein